ncbi:MAG: hypothetical protein NT154_23705 [Verrucomicrobia bacterium]|nr:hypothetical protein [Verrucomicrobiota bacterium]
MNPTNLTSAVNTLAGELLVGPGRAAGIKSLLGDKITIEVVKSANTEIPECLRTQHRPGATLELHQTDIVGVRCGPASNGLVVAGFSTMQDLDRFLADNGSLSASPVTKWNEVPLLWLRTDFIAKRNLYSAELIWLVHGVVPLAWLREEQAPATVIKPGTPALIRYDEIVWPGSATGTMRYAFLESLYGPFFLRAARKKVLNLSLWAAWLSERLQVHYDARPVAFRRYQKPGELGQILPSGVITELVTAALQQSATVEPTKFPITEIRPRRIAELIELMKSMTTLRPPMSEAEGLAEFFRIRLVRKVGADVTSIELWEAYQAYCQAAGCLSYTKHEFLETVPGRIKELYGRTRSNGLMRGGYRRGYHGLALIGDGADVAPGQAAAAPGGPVLGPVTHPGPNAP